MKVPVVAGFPITDDVVLRKLGTHFDVPFEVSNHGRRSEADGIEFNPRGTWCYYVSVSEQMVRPEEFALFWLEPTGTFKRSGVEEPIYHYGNASFADAKWHGGVTYYKKFGSVDGTPRVVKIGCDFAHIWDDGHDYTLDFVEYEAKETINALRRMFSFLRRCNYNGRWMPEADMVADEHGRLYSPEGKAANDAWRAERAAKGAIA